MKLTIKRRFQAMAEHTIFPMFFYSYDSGRIIAANEGAKNLIGEEAKSVSQIWREGSKKRIAEKLSAGDCAFFPQEKIRNGDYFLEVDVDLFSFLQAEERIIAVLLEQSYKRAFSEERENYLPRILWKDSKLCLQGQNSVSLRVMEDGAKIEPGYEPENPYDKEGIKKVFALEKQLLEEKQDSYGVLQQMGLREKRRGFAQINRLLLFDRNGECEGLLLIYELLQEYEEINAELCRLLRQNAALEECQRFSRRIAYSIQMDENGTVDYISAGVERFGYRQEEFCSKKLGWLEIVCPEDREKLKNRENSLEETDYCIFAKNGKKIHIHEWPQKVTSYQGKLFCQGILWQTDTYREGEQ